MEPGEGPAVESLGLVPEAKKQRRLSNLHQNVLHTKLNRSNALLGLGHQL